MPQAVIALATEDFEVYHDLAQHMRAAGVPFETVSPRGPIPGHVAVVITTSAEAPLVPHGEVVVYTQPEATVEETVRRLKGLHLVHTLVLGVDPGERPGLAVVADGRVLASRQTGGLDELVHDVLDTVARYEGARVVVRVGHGDATKRDRLVNELLAAGLEVQVVDETSTTPPGMRKSAERDAAAARAIALTHGITVENMRPIRVPPGEIKEIQRRSRLASNGRVTISRRLARRVATGRLSLAEAVSRQRRKKVEGR